MKNFMICLCAVGSLIAPRAFAQTMDSKGLQFVAPTINGKSNVADPEAGEIIYDYSDGHFYGYDIGLPGWVDMNSSSAANTSSDEVSNLGIATAVSSNALTISLKQSNGGDPASGPSAVKLGFRNATSSTGQYVQRSVTGALSVVVSSGSTLGTLSGVASYIYVYAIDNAGTVELAVSSQLYDSGSVVTTTAEGGAGGADSLNVIYSTTARSNVPVRSIGRLKLTETTAGTWASNSTEISLSPFSKGEVTSSAQGERLERALVTSKCSTTCNIDSKTPGIAGIFRTADGDYYVSFVPGYFSSAPSCVCSAVNNGTSTALCGSSGPPTTSSWTFQTANLGSGVLTNTSMQIICMGPR